MTRFDLSDIEACAMDDVTPIEALELLNRDIQAHNHQRAVDSEGEALAPTSVLLDGAGIELKYTIDK